MHRHTGSVQTILLAGVVLLTVCKQKSINKYKKREKTALGALEVGCTRARERTEAKTLWLGVRGDCAGNAVTLAVLICPPGTILQRTKRSA